MDFDVRASFPSLADGVARFDGPGGSQAAAPVAAAVAQTMTAGLGNRGEARAEAVVADARSAVGDLLGCDPGGVVFGRSMTALTYELARTLSAGWAPGDEVIVTALDHDANIRPWAQAAEAVGAVVRWAQPVEPSWELPVAAVESLLSRRTRLVAVTGASNLVGTRPALAEIGAAAHEVAGAVFFVDGVHLTPHSPVAVDVIGADVYACSPYKFFGPHLGVLAAAPAFWEPLRPWKLAPSTDAVPERFELGTLPFELLAGTTAAVDLIASWGDGPTRRDRVLNGMALAANYEQELLLRLLDGLGALPRVRVVGSAARRTPTVLFRVDGVAPAEVSARLAARGIVAPSGHFYAQELSRLAGLGDEGGTRVGLAAYTSAEDVDRLLEAVAELA